MKEEKVVFVTGVYDLFHYGHVRFLKKAKEMGTYLLVGVHTDDAVNNYKKRETVMKEQERLEVVQACRYVDEAILIPEQTKLDRGFYEGWYIKLQVQGDDFDDYSLPKELKIFKLVPYTEGISTSQIIKRMTQRVTNIMKDLIKDFRG
jgi:cytidyltransferase-like protein